MMQEIAANNNITAIAKAEFDIQITTAKAYPRNVDSAIKEAVKMVGRNQEVAQSCMYKLPPRKGKDGKEKEITGYSIRLAEIMAQTWGNLHAASRVIKNDGSIIVAEAVAWDLEKNVKVGSEVSMSIVSTGRDGKKYTYSTDMQAMISNAACAKALRNAIFKVIPKALIDEVYKEAVKVGLGEMKNIPELINKMIERFNKMGVPTDKILTYFGKTKDEITQQDVETMIGFGTAIKQGDISIDEAFNNKRIDVINDDVEDLNRTILGE